MALAAPRLTLLRQQSPLAETARQRQVLGDVEARLGRPFGRSVLESQGMPLTTGPIEILQVNVGKLCNQTCHHCHVDAGPERREQMSPETAAACLHVLRQSAIGTLDITGGAPEMNPQFRRLVTEGTALGRRVIDRCNLTILTAPGYTDLPEFLAAHRVEIVASLPCYLEANTDKQRGDGVFQKSLAALRRLNELGYGMPGRDLSLTLVYNPVGPSLPPPQAKLEADYRRELRSRYGIEFTRLFTITNLPISRFLEELVTRDRLEEYGRKLVDAYNPATLRGLMCRNTLSVDWTGRLYDCDFNQMLELPVERGYPATIFEVAEQGLAALDHRPITTGFHCYGCTAGAGSGCQGSVVG